MYTVYLSLTNYFESSSTMTPNPPTELHAPIYGVTKAIGPS
jgi:hypothetical protein